MAQVISATTKFAQRVHATGRAHQGGLAKHVAFLAKAEDLLSRARAAAADDRFNDSVELAYQAGLRAAGAWIAVPPVGKRKRVPSSAWDQLALIGGPAREWAQEFRGYSRLRSRLVTGLEDAADPDVALRLLETAATFVAVVRSEGAAEQAAA